MVEVSEHHLIWVGGDVAKMLLSQLGMQAGKLINEQNVIEQKDLL